MWFKWICFVLAFACVTKGIIGIVFHKNFYTWDKKQYTSRHWPTSFLLFIPYGIGMISWTWYATLFHYTKHGWIITITVTIVSIKFFAIIFQWKKTSTFLVQIIDTGGWKIWFLDVLMIVSGFSFFLLGIFVYS